jgi:protein-S-isoprenylcysteine O-methyltransferase Ste14
MGMLDLKVPPVALILVCGLVMWVISTACPAVAFPLPGARAVAVAFALVGGGIAVTGVFAFRRHSTTVNPTAPDTTKSIVRDGIYRYTRNPMYLGFALILAGWAIFLANMASLLMLPAFVAYMTQFQIKPEERALLARFGPDYAEYMAKVRRWV